MLIKAAVFVAVSCVLLCSNLQETRLTLFQSEKTASQSQSEKTASQSQSEKTTSQSSTPDVHTPGSPAQATAGASQPIRLRTDLVVVDVLPVQKKTARVIGDLKGNDFSVFEDGVKQTITHFSKETVPVSIVLLVDRAGCVNAFSDQ